MGYWTKNDSQRQFDVYTIVLTCRSISLWWQTFQVCLYVGNVWDTWGTDLVGNEQPRAGKWKLTKFDKQSHIFILYLKHVHDIVLKLMFASFENLFTELIFKKASDILHFMRDRI